MNWKITKQVVFFAGLFIVAVPWYWQFVPELSQARCLGLPFWVIGSLLGSSMISVQTARILLRPWEGEEQALREDGQE